ADSPDNPAGPGILFKLRPSQSRNFAPLLKTRGLAMISTLPFVSSAAGPSATPSVPGKSGPAVHVPVRVSKIAVWAAPHRLAPMAKTVLSGRKAAGPTSYEALSAPLQESHSWTTVLPALDQVPEPGL